MLNEAKEEFHLLKEKHINLIESINYNLNMGSNKIMLKFDDCFQCVVQSKSTEEQLVRQSQDTNLNFNENNITFKQDSTMIQNTSDNNINLNLPPPVNIKLKEINTV